VFKISTGVFTVTLGFLHRLTVRNGTAINDESRV